MTTNTNDITAEKVREWLDADENPSCEFPGVNLFDNAKSIARAFVAKCEEVIKAHDYAGKCAQAHWDIQEENRQLHEKVANLFDTRAQLIRKTEDQEGVISKQKAALENASMPDYWKEVVGVDRYKPKYLGRHKAAHPSTIKDVLLDHSDSTAADVIVALIHELHVVRNREQYFIGAMKELEKEALALTEHTEGKDGNR